MKQETADNTLETETSPAVFLIPLESMACLDTTFLVDLVRANPEAEKKLGESLGLRETRHSKGLQPPSAQRIPLEPCLLAMFRIIRWSRFLLSLLNGAARVSSRPGGVEEKLLEKEKFGLRKEDLSLADSLFSGLVGDPYFSYSTK